MLRWLLVVMVATSFLLGELSLREGWHIKESYASSVRICTNWFKKRRYVQAADCFLQLTYKAGEPKEQQKRYRVGIWMRNAMLAFKKAATQEKRVERAAFLRERAVRIAKRYLAKRYYATATQKNIVTTTMNGLIDAIGYANLTVISGQRNATIRVLGYRYQVEGKESWSNKVRPGRYSIIVSAPRHPSQAKSVVVVAGEPKLVRFDKPYSPSRPRPIRRVGPPPSLRKVVPRPKPEPPPRSKTLPIVLMGGGAAIALGGGGLLGWGAATLSERNDVAERSPQTVDDTREIRDLQSSAKGQIVTGWVLVGVGVVTAGIGTILLVSRPTAKALPKDNARARAQGFSIPLLGE